MECPVCYCDQANCKLVCKHSFCKSCVKSWYEKSDEPTCPMCRHKLYFKGLYKLERIWEQERNEKINQQAFNDEFDYIFEDEFSDWETSSENDSEESESDSESESSEDPEEPEQPEDQQELVETEPRFSDMWIENHYSHYMLGEIKELQEKYKKAMELGVNFDWYVNNHMFYNFSYEPRYWIEDDVFPHEKNLFVSNHKGYSNAKRNNTRVPPKGDTSFIFVVNIEVF